MREYFTANFQRYRGERLLAPQLLLAFRFEGGPIALGPVNVRRPRKGGLTIWCRHTAEIVLLVNNCQVVDAG